MRSTVLIAMVLFSGLGHAFDLQPYTASYQFNLNQQLTGTATRSLTKLENNHYRYRFSASAAIANANEESEFSFNNQQIQSLSYQNTKQVLFKTKTDKASFDWPNQTLIGQRKGESTN